MGLRRAKRLRELRRPAEAREEALAGLRRSVVIGDRRRVVQLLDLLALLAADEALTERAGRFRGAIEAELDREPLSAWEMTDLGAATGYGGVRPRACARLGDAARGGRARRPVLAHCGTCSVPQPRSMISTR